MNFLFGNYSRNIVKIYLQKVFILNKFNRIKTIKELFGKIANLPYIQYKTFFLFTRKEGLIDIVKKYFIEGVYLPRSLAYCMNLVNNKDINKILFMQALDKEKKLFSKIFAKNILMLIIFNLNA